MNKVLKLCFLIVAILGATNHTIAQKKKEIKKGNQEFTDYSFIDAQEQYLEVVNSGYKTVDILKGLGDSYYFTAAYENAAQWYKELFTMEGFDRNSSSNTEYLYRYAQSLKSVEDYDTADAIMKEYKLAIGEDLDSEKNKRNYREEIKRNSGRYTINAVDFNSPLSDFGTAYWGDSIVFASNRLVNDKKAKLHEWNDQPFLDMYSITLSNNSTQGATPVKIEGDLNSIYHESTMVYSKREDAVYFTRNNFSKNDYKTDQKGTNRLKLYRGKINEKGKWEIEELSFNSNEYSVAHPALSIDEKTLYFVSDMPGGYGNSDLYKTTIGDNGFGWIENLGPEINTEGRDTFPFISKDNFLYFSSDVHEGLGGLDVFTVDLNQGTRNVKVHNVGKPVNSNRDDFSFIFDSKTRKGYFSSNRDGGMGNDDIYSFLEVRPLNTACEQMITGTVKDKNTGNIIADATVILMDEDNKVIYETTSDNNGKFNLGTIKCETWYTARATKEGYSIAEERFKTTDEVDLILDLQLNLTPKGLGPNIAIGEDLSGLLKIENINFDYDKSFIRKDAAIELQKVIDYMNTYPTVKIDVRSHTDARGSDSYNLSLSKRRNKSTIRWIIEKGNIDASRVTGRGYGETQLLNECSNGVKCSDKLHEQNRRSEFIVVQK